ncbi:MAG: carbohydrate ABC transporter permease [Chloroflexota bacterium]
MKQNISNNLRQYVFILPLVLPALIGIVVFQLWPIYESVRVSFFDFNMLSGSLKWIGGQNYLRTLKDPIFWLTVKNTIWFFFLKVPLQMAFAFGLALLVQTAARWIGILRTIILLPAITSMVVVSVIWGLMYHPNNGLINSFLQFFSLPPQPFLISQQQSMPSIAAMMIWKDVGFNMIFFLAGLMGIPVSIYEAAKIDGADYWQITRYITIPMIKRTTIFVLITNLVTAFKVFTPIFLMTRGGPASSTRVIVLYLYENAFIYNKMGYAAAISILLGVTLMIVSYLSTREKPY